MTYDWNTVVSLFALIVSGFAWRASHRAAKAAEASNAIQLDSFIAPVLTNLALTANDGMRQGANLFSRLQPVAESVTKARILIDRMSGSRAAHHAVIFLSQLSASALGEIEGRAMLAKLQLDEETMTVLNSQYQDGAEIQALAATLWPQKTAKRA